MTEEDLKAKEAKLVEYATSLRAATEELEASKTAFEDYKKTEQDKLAERAQKLNVIKAELVQQQQAILGGSEHATPAS